MGVMGVTFEATEAGVVRMEDGLAFPKGPSSYSYVVYTLGFRGSHVTTSGILYSYMDPLGRDKDMDEDMEKGEGFWGVIGICRV